MAAASQDRILNLAHDSNAGHDFRGTPGACLRQLHERVPEQVAER